MTSRVFLALLILTSPLFCDQMLLDDMMNKEDQMRTGVRDLSPKQKVALEVWLNEHCPCANEAPVREIKQQPLFLSINVDNGKKIQLTDGSMWEVDPRDYTISAAWLSPMPIKIMQSGDRNFPFLLTNKNTGISIRARQTLTMEPASPSPIVSPPQPAPSTPNPPPGTKNP